jgi:hypothetical protein
VNTGHGYHVDAMNTVNIMLTDSVQQWELIDCQHLPKLVAKAKEDSKQSEETLMMKAVLNPTSDMLMDFHIPIYSSTFLFSVSKFH